MGVVYSMYDALVSINVPDEKAKAVIDALEREMMDKLATKADVAHLQELLVRDLQMLRTDTERGLEALRADMGHGLEAVRADMGRGLEALRAVMGHGLGAVRADMGHGVEALRADMGHSLEKLESRILFKVGTMMAASLVLTCTVLGTLLAALR